MSERSITLHMSSKRAMEKKKARSRKAEHDLKIEIKHNVMQRKMKGVLDQYTNTMGHAIAAEI